MSSPSSSSTPAIGIDLGTTNSCIAYYNQKTDQVEIIPNSLGERITPSSVYFSPDSSEILVGKLAQETAQDLQQPYISHVKRFIGQKAHQCDETLDNLEYPIHIDHNDYPLIPITTTNQTQTQTQTQGQGQTQGQTKNYKAEEISAQVLSYLKSCAQDYLGQPITEAVITVPAYFNEAQRRATKDACTIAGLKCLRLVAEPTSACLCYGLHRRDREIVLVFDWGGGTIDVSILKLTGGIFEVIATSGNTQLGGADLDYILLDHLRQQYCLQIKQSSQDQAKTHLTQETAEKAKKALRNMSQTTIRAPPNFKYVLTRSKLEDLILPIIEECLEPVDKVLQDAEMTTSEISQIVLVGGSTRVPLIQEKLQEMFGKDKPLNKSINPDEAVAYGAAIQASILKNQGSQSKELLLLDVTPLSLGIETAGGIMNRIIKRNSTLPCEVTKMYSTVDDNQESVEIKVYQGEREFTRDNIALATFTLDGLPRVPRGVPKIKVSFKLNCDGLLEVSAVDKNTGMTKSVEVTPESNLNPTEIQRLIEEAEKFRTQDQLKRQIMEEFTQYEKDTYETQRQINLPENAEALKEDLSQINQYLMNTIDWIVQNRATADLDTVRNSRATVDYNLKPYLEKMYSYQNQLKESGLPTQDKQCNNDPESIEAVLEEIGFSS